MSLFVCYYGARLLEFAALRSLGTNLHEYRANLLVVDSFKYVNAKRASLNLSPTDCHVNKVLAMRDRSVTHSHASISIIRDFIPDEETLRSLYFYLHRARVIAFN